MKVGISLGFALLLAVASPVSAQTERAAVVVEWDDERTSTLRDTLRANLNARGLDVLPNDAVEAARAFSGGPTPLNPERAAALRTQLHVEHLVWVAAQPQGERLLLAVRHVTGQVAQAFGAAPLADPFGPAIALLRQAWPESDEPPPTPAIAPVTPPMPDPPTDPTAPSGPTEAVQGREAPTSDAITSVTGPGRVDTPPSGPEEPRPQPTATQEPSAQASNADEPPSPQSVEPAISNRTERVRFAIVGFAGIEAYGYGGGVRLELPFGGVVTGVDDSIGIGFDVGVGYINLGLDNVGTGVEGFQIPAAAYLTWRFGLDDIEIGPRIGGVLVTRVGEWTGTGISGTRISVVGMALVGSTFAVWLGDAVQLFAGLDLAIGPRLSGVISAGVAF